MACRKTFATAFLEQKERKIKCPIAYLITFSTYGTWLHGDKRGSVDKEYNRYRDDFVALDMSRQKRERIALKNQPIVLSAKQREVVLAAILRVCEFRGWVAHAVHIRANHIHVVVSGQAKPEKMMVDFKAYATRALRRSQEQQGEVTKYWTRHGSTKYIWTKERLASAIRYVKNEQGKMMAFGSSQSPEC